MFSVAMAIATRTPPVPMTTPVRPSEIQTVAAIPRIQRALRPTATALRFGARELSFEELDRSSSRSANGLLHAGLNRGARVAILSQDSDEVFELLFGIAKAGCVMTGINWRLAAPEVQFILENGEVEALFVDRDRLSLALNLLDSLPDIRLVVCLGSNQLDTNSSGVESYCEWRDSQSEKDPEISIAPEDIFAQLYTSGTTGKPKGVRLAHRSFFAVVNSMAQAGDEWIGWNAEDVTLFNIPSFHIGGLWWAMTALRAGACAVILPVFDPAKVLECVPLFQVTKVCMVPAMIQMTLAENGSESVDWTSLKHLVYGGAPISKVLLERSNRVLDCDLIQIYGLTETGNTAICLRADDHARDELLSAAGRPYPGVELKIIDTAGEPVPCGTIGEVCLRSPANMVEYWKLPEATASTLRDGWVHTGDAGYVNDEGYLFICDRIKDMIISAGENVYPAEIESVLAAYPGIAEAAVIGVPDKRWGEKILGLLVRSEDEQGDAVRKRGVLAHCSAHLADFKVPVGLEFRKQLPRTASGKIKKAELRAPFWEGEGRNV